MQRNQFDHLFKFILMGDSGSGKTSVWTRYTENVVRRNYTPTNMMEFKNKDLTINNKQIRLQIWDDISPSAMRFQMRNMSFLRGGHAIIIVFDVTDRTSFNNLSNHVNTVLRFSNTGTILILGNKTDLSSRRVISAQEARTFAENNQATYMEVSALTGENVELSFFQLATTILNRVNPAPAVMQRPKQSQTTQAPSESSSSFRDRLKRHLPRLFSSTTTNTESSQGTSTNSQQDSSSSSKSKNEFKLFEQEQKVEGIPEIYVCPISLEVIENPITLVTSVKGKEIYTNVDMSSWLNYYKSEKRKDYNPKDKDAIKGIQNPANRQYISRIIHDDGKLKTEINQQCKHMIVKLFYDMLEKKFSNVRELVPGQLEVLKAEIKDKVNKYFKGEQNIAVFFNKHLLSMFNDWCSMQTAKKPPSEEETLALINANINDLTKILKMNDLLEMMKILDVKVLQIQKELNDNKTSLNPIIDDYNGRLALKITEAKNDHSPSKDKVSKREIINRDQLMKEILDIVAKHELYTEKELENFTKIIFTLHADFLNVKHEEQMPNTGRVLRSIANAHKEVTFKFIESITNRLNLQSKTLPYQFSPENIKELPLMDYFTKALACLKDEKTHAQGMKMLNEIKETITDTVKQQAKMSL